jgi:aminoglycoside phosphotransferase (APT) family kinase protein
MKPTQPDAETSPASPPQETEIGADLRKLRAYVDSEVTELAHMPLSIRLLTGGHSNLTYALSDGVREWVLRRPPLGSRQSGAHDMGREFRVMDSLCETAVPVPRMLHFCADPRIIGAPFLIAEFVRGTVFGSTHQTSGLGPQRARNISRRTVDVLCDLHLVDPAQIELADFGRPEGFLDRQVARWTRRAEELLREEPGIDELVAGLRSATPSSPAPALIHGDYRLENLIVDDRDRIAAVLDWELATLGDPLTDLGLLQCFWNGVDNPGGDNMRKGVDPALGFPPFPELTDLYVSRTGTDVSKLGWYAALGYLKLATLRAQIHRRYQAGETPAGFSSVSALIAPLVRQSLKTLEAS